MEKRTVDLLIAMLTDSYMNGASDNDPVSSRALKWRLTSTNTNV